MPPNLGPSPLTVYSYMLPAEVYRLANWLRLIATNRSMMVPKR